MHYETLINKANEEKSKDSGALKALNAKNETKSEPRKLGIIL